MRSPWSAISPPTSQSRESATVIPMASPANVSATGEPRRSKLSVVLFSGGSGTQSITEACLKRPQIAVTILINAYDDGHSTGRLRRFIPGMLGPSDVRKNISRLMPQSQESHRALRFLSHYRMPQGIDYATTTALATHVPQA